MRTIRAIKVLENVPVLLRTSLNAPIQDGKVGNAFRLASAVPTIEYLQKRGARIILASHISGTGTETLRPMFEALRGRIQKLSFSDISIGPVARERVRRMAPGEVLMLENLRRHKGEEKNDSVFARELASLADVFVQDSFDTCHRKHASIIGVPEYLPAYAGLQVEKEVKELTKALSPRHPSLAIIAGAKFATKEPVLKKLLKSYDHVFVGGALANDFIRAKGHSVGVSLVSEEGQAGMRLLMKNKRLVIPLDAIVAVPGSNRAHAHAVSLKEIPDTEAVLDAGPHTVAALGELAQRAKTVLWNGPLGLFEDGFIDGTRALAHAIPQKARTVIGGGDTIAALDQLKLTDTFSFVSTGGGAMIDFLAEGTLPGLDVLK